MIRQRITIYNFEQAGLLKNPATSKARFHFVTEITLWDSIEIRRKTSADKNV